MKKNIVAIVLFLGSAVFSGATQAAVITFDQAQLLSMDEYYVQNTMTVLGGTSDLSAGPGAGAYGGGDIEIMTGVAGSNEFLNTNSALYYTLNPDDLAELNGSLTAGDLFRMIGFNDNANDNWVLGIWYEADGNSVKGDALVTDSAMIAAGSGATLSLALPGGPLDGIGVFIASGSFNDQFHASWSPVPEPTSMAIMGLGTLLAGFGVRRRKRKMAEMAA